MKSLHPVTKRDLQSHAWSDVSSRGFGVRYFPAGYLFDGAGPIVVGSDISFIVALMNSKPFTELAKELMPNLHFKCGTLQKMPYVNVESERIAAIGAMIIQRYREECYGLETQRAFTRYPLLPDTTLPPMTLANGTTLESSYTVWTHKNRETIAEMKRLEEENNRLFIDAYGLQDELTPEVPIEQITLTVNPAYRYGWKGDREQGLGVSEEGVILTPDPYTLYPDLAARFREDTMQELVSYAIGCMMGRYRLDRPGLIYAHSGNEHFWTIYEGENRNGKLTPHPSPLTPTPRGVSEELPGSDCVAEVDGIGGTGLPNDQSLSSGGAVRLEQSDSAGGGFDSVEHCGGPCPAKQGGVSELPLYRTGLQGRSGDADPNRDAPGICHETASRSDPLSASRVIQDAQHSETQTNPSPLIPNPFPPDADGILPITDTDWFDEDAAHRLVEFIAVAWDQAHLEENLSFLAANLSPKNGESSRETLRRYLSDRFFKDHLQTYKNRPIYWCFSSGKQKAFQCLVYLHRYHSGTLARMRMEYVVPLQSKMAARIESLADDIQAASSSAQTKRLQKERDRLIKQLEELRRFDEQLRHHADQRIALDLDDGVKVNYGKFGDLLAEVKTVTGQKSD